MMMNKKMEMTENTMEQVSAGAGKLVGYYQEDEACHQEDVRVRYEAVGYYQEDVS